MTATRLDGECVRCEEMREPRLALQFGVGAHGGWQYTESGPTGSEWGGQQQGPGMELSWEACFLLAVGGTAPRPEL